MTSESSSAAEHTGTQRRAIGYLRTDVTTTPGYDTARLRLTALAHGFTLTRILTATHVSQFMLLLIAVEFDQAAIVLTPNPRHLPGTQHVAVRHTCELRAGNRLLPRITDLPVEQHTYELPETDNSRS